MAQADVTTLYFGRDGLIPNHPTLPVIVYHGAFKENPGDTEFHFNQNGWLGSWTNGVFSYHHYHSNAHEVLGVIQGSVYLQLGGEHGQQVHLAAGDVALLPAGTGHKKLSSSPDFKIVGAYPEGMDYNTRKGTLEEYKTSVAEIPNVPLPATDPVYGKEGPVHERWKQTDAG